MLSKHKYRRICIAYGIKNHEILIIDIRMVFKKERQYQSNTTSHMGGPLDFVLITSIEGDRKDMASLRFVVYSSQF